MYIIFWPVYVLTPYVYDLSQFLIVFLPSVHFVIFNYILYHLSTTFFIIFVLWLIQVHKCKIWAENAQIIDNCLTNNTFKERLRNFNYSKFPYNIYKNKKQVTKVCYIVNILEIDRHFTTKLNHNQSNSAI